MGWLKNFFKRIVVEAVTEVLEPRLRTIVQEEFVRLEPHLRVMLGEEFVRLEPLIRAIVREELRAAMEEEWVPRLQATWREDINRMQDRFNTRFDSVQGRLDNLAEMMLHATVQVREMGELAELVRSLRSEVERIKAHIGLT